MRDSGQFTDDEIEDIKRKICVISPITLTLYIHWLQMESYIKMSDPEKEKMLLEKITDRFKARYKGNASNRQAREPSPDEEVANGCQGQPNDAEELKRKRNMTFTEFLKEFGEEIKKTIGQDEGKAA